MRGLVAFFLLMQIFIVPYAGTNPASRAAHLAALSVEHRYIIDNYQSWTEDWSRGPDGHYYSNKAPGPVFAAWPLSAAAFAIASSVTSDATTRVLEWRGPWMHFLSLLFQAFPWAALALILAKKFAHSDFSIRERKLWLAVFLWGSTASLFMNTYFGHSWAAVLALGCVLCLQGLDENPSIRAKCQRGFLSAFLFSWLVLSDYAALPVVPFFSIALLWKGFQIPRPARAKFVGACALGALPALFLWCHYHLTCFGGILSLPNKFQNPAFQDLAQSEHALWGVFHLLPQPRALFELIAGAQRGLLLTQPWILVVAVCGVIDRLSPKPALRASLFWQVAISFAGAFWVNASFGAWHGGSSSGPRYLAWALPLFILWIPSLWPRMSRRARVLLAASAFWSLAFSFLAFNVDNQSQAGLALLPTLLSKALSGGIFPRGWRFLLTFAIALVLIAWPQRDRAQSANSP